MGKPKFPPPIVRLGETPVRTRRAKRVREAQLAFCHDCNDVIWTISHPYWNSSQVSHMHKRGTGHQNVRLYVMDGPLSAPFVIRQTDDLEAFVGWECYETHYGAEVEGYSGQRDLEGTEQFDSIEEAQELLALFENPEFPPGPAGEFEIVPLELAQYDFDAILRAVQS